MFPDMPHVRLLKKIPSCLTQQSTSDPPAAVGISFAPDVLKRNRQLILAVRETVSSFTTSCTIEDERRNTVRSALIRLCLKLRPISGPCAVVRVDPDKPPFLFASRNLHQCPCLLHCQKLPKC